MCLMGNQIVSDKRAQLVVAGIDVNEIASFRGQLVELYGESDAAHDKTAQALAGGGIAVSLVLLERAASGPQAPVGLGWLVASWIAWTLTLTAVVLGQRLAIANALRGIRDAEEILSLEGAIGEAIQSYERLMRLSDTRRARMARGASTAASVLVISGFVGAGLFAFANFAGGQGHAEGTTAVSTTADAAVTVAPDGSAGEPGPELRTHTVEGAEPTAASAAKEVRPHSE